MSFQNPIALWGLLGLLIPMIVLLLSKRKQEVIEFGSLAFLDASESQTAKTIFPSQWLKFFMRVLIILLMVLVFARALFKSDGQNHLVFVEEALWQDPTFDKDLISNENLIRFSFQKEVDEDVLSLPSMDVLIKKLQKESDSITVYTYNFARNYLNSGSKIRGNVNWLIWPAKESIDKTYELAEEDRPYLNIQSDEDGLRWDLSKNPNANVEVLPSIGINIIASTRVKKEGEKLASIISAFGDQMPIEFEFNAEEKAKWTITIDTFVNDYPGQLLEWRTTSSPLELKVLANEHFSMIGDLSAENLVGSNLPLQLASILTNGVFEIENMDARLADAPPTFVDSQNIVQAKTTNRRHLLVFLLLFAILIERFLSFKMVKE